MCHMLRLLLSLLLLIAILTITLAVNVDDVAGASESSFTGTSESKVATIVTDINLDLDLNIDNTDTSSVSSSSGSVGDTAPTTSTSRNAVETHQYKSEVDTPSSSSPSNHRKLRTNILASSFEHMKRDHPVTKFHNVLNQAFHRSKIFSGTQHKQQGVHASKTDVDIHEEEEEHDQEEHDDEEDEGRDFERLLRKKNGSKPKSPKHPKKMKYPNNPSEPDKDARDVEDLKQCHARLEDTLEDLDQCNQALNATVYLWVQMGDQCTIHRANGNKYKLIVKKMKDVTWQFSDRPRRIELEISTKDFVDSFDSTFSDSRPNAAVTFHTTQNVTSEAPLVSIFLEAAHEDDNLFDDFLSVTYMLDQSEDQEGIVSLESYFHDGQDEATFEDCSVFIDSETQQCSPSCKNDQTTWGWDGGSKTGTVEQCCNDNVAGITDCNVNGDGNICNCPNVGSPPCKITAPECPIECQYASDYADYGTRSAIYKFYDIIDGRKCCETADGVGTEGKKCSVNDNRLNGCTCPHHQGLCYIDTRCDPFMTYWQGKCISKPYEKCQEGRMYKTDQDKCPLRYEYWINTGSDLPLNQGYCKFDGERLQCTLGYKCKIPDGKLSLASNMFCLDD